MAGKVKHVLNVKQRSAGGSAVARRERKTGLIPTVIYSKGAESKTVSVQASEWDALQKYELNLLSLQEDGKETLVLLKEVQHDFIRNRAMHLDFMEVRKDQVITAHVAVHAAYGDVKGVALGGILDQVIHELEVECIPENLPESIEVNISELGVGESLHVSEIVPPEGVKILNHPELVVFLIADPNAQPEEELAPATAEEGAAEPEVIGEKEKAEKAAAAEAEGKKK